MSSNAVRRPLEFLETHGPHFVLVVSGFPVALDPEDAAEVIRCHAEGWSLGITKSHGSCHVVMRHTDLGTSSQLGRLVTHCTPYQVVRYRGGFNDIRKASLTVITLDRRLAYASKLHQIQSALRTPVPTPT